MLGPYRTPPEPEPRSDPPRDDSVLAIVWLLLLFGGVRLVVAILLREPPHFEAALAGLLCGVGVVLLYQRSSRSRRG